MCCVVCPLYIIYPIKPQEYTLNMPRLYLYIYRERDGGGHGPWERQRIRFYTNSSQSHRKVQWRNYLRTVIYFILIRRLTSLSSGPYAPGKETILSTLFESSAASQPIVFPNRYTARSDHYCANVELIQLILDILMPYKGDLFLVCCATNEAHVVMIWRGKEISSAAAWSAY